jgi:hypothetical protein
MLAPSNVTVMFGQVLLHRVALATTVIDVASVPVGVVTDPVAVPFAEKLTAFLPDA